MAAQEVDGDSRQGIMPQKQPSNPRNSIRIWELVTYSLRLTPTMVWELSDLAITKKG
jgi:hypothetical protein